MNDKKEEKPFQIDPPPLYYYCEARYKDPPPPFDPIEVKLPDWDKETDENI